MRVEFLGDTLPHLTGAQTRIAELVDERLDDGSSILGPALALREKCPFDRLGEVQALDALGGPVGRKLLSTHSPNLLVVGLEENTEEAVAELIADPVLQGLRI